MLQAHEVSGDLQEVKIMRRQPIAEQSSKTELARSLLPPGGFH